MGQSLPGHQSLESQANQLQWHHVLANVAIICYWKSCYFRFYPHFSHFSHLFMCVKCCVTTQFLVRLSEFYTFIARIERSFFFSFLNTIPRRVAHVGLELSIFLPQHPKCWHYRYTALCIANIYHFWTHKNLCLKCWFTTVRNKALLLMVSTE